MSKDWTPRELAFVDANMGFSKSKTVLQCNGEGVVLYDPDSEMSKSFKWFLLGLCEYIRI